MLSSSISSLLTWTHWSWLQCIAEWSTPVRRGVARTQCQTEHLHHMAHSNSQRELTQSLVSAPRVQEEGGRQRIACRGFEGGRTWNGSWPAGENHLIQWNCASLNTISVVYCQQTKKDWHSYNSFLVWNKPIWVLNNNTLYSTQLHDDQSRHFHAISTTSSEYATYLISCLLIRTINFRSIPISFLSPAWGSSLTGLAEVVKNCFSLV